MNNITAAYRHHGAVLEMSRRDAHTLVARGVGVMDPAFNAENGLLGVHVLGEKIDRLVPSESPRLFLVGGIEITRDDYWGDSITSIKPINIDGLFDEEEA